MSQSDYIRIAREIRYAIEHKERFHIVMKVFDFNNVLAALKCI